MSTELKSNNASATTLPTGLRIKTAIVVAEWNSHITNALRDGAVNTLNGAGYEDIDIFYVPGAVELTFAASQLINLNRYDSVIVFGCVIRGGTPHFDYVCESVTQGVTHLNTIYSTPVIFGVLTVDDEQQAIDRIGGKYGNKGSEAAETAIKMCDFILKLQ